MSALPPAAAARARPLFTVAAGAAMGAVVGVACGLGAALFLCLLDGVTRAREGLPWLVFLLPVAGLAMGTASQRTGASVKGGSNLIIDAIRDGGPRLPVHVAPWVLGGTLVTHLFGGSAGREGTAVQMGAGLADGLAHGFARFAGLPRAHWLIAGAAGGFGAVFGTPFAGALFGMEFVTIGRLRLGAVVPAVSAALIGDVTTRALGIVHTAYPRAPHVPLSLALLGKWAAFALAVAAVAALFIELVHAIKRHGERLAPHAGLRAAAGGGLVLVLFAVFGAEYLGLGLPTILRSFADPTLPPFAFALKLLFTAVTVGTGFLGGEVTPLFFAGAALGNALSAPLGLPLELCAGVGLAAVFAAAANTPIALAVMAAELLGVQVLPHAAIVCALAYLMTGNRSLYAAQRASGTKLLGRARGGSRGQPPPKI